MPKIMIDAGHGGKDPGAVGGGWMEKDINLEAALHIGARLTELGFQVGYTRTTDTFDGDLMARGKLAKGYDYFLSLHCNAGGGTGAEVYTNCKETYAFTETALQQKLGAIVGWRRIISRNYQTGEFIHRPVKDKMFTSTIGLLDWYGVLRGCWSVGTSGNLLEMFFIDNPADRAKFDADRKVVYEAIVEAICEAFDIVYTEKVPDCPGVHLPAQAEILRLRSIIAGYEANCSTALEHLGKAIKVLQ